MKTNQTDEKYSTPQVVVLGSLATLTEGSTYGQISTDWGGDGFNAK